MARKKTAIKDESINKPAIVSRDPAPVVRVRLPRCPNCGATSIRCDGGSRSRANGARVSYCTCTTCGQRVIIFGE